VSSPNVGERRQVAVLFCDVVDSTPLSRRLDIEEFAELMLDVQRVATDVVERFGGTIGDYAGDGLVAWFGWPTAHEDDTALAVLAGLETLAGFEHMNETLERDRGVSVAARVGVHVGLVVLRTDRADTPAFGEAIHIAARLESFADPGTIVISDVAHRLVGRRFRTTELGEQRLKGIEQPIAIYRVDGTRDDLGPSPTGADRTPFVGRRDELARLHAVWSTIAAGNAGTCLITGEPGVGKSRLLGEFTASIAEEPHRWLEARCDPRGVNTAFGPVAELIRRALGIARGDGEAEQTRKLDAAFAPQQKELIAGLLGVSTSELPASDRFRRELMAAIEGWLRGLADTTPLVLAIEDLHWSDPSTLELIRMLQTGLASSRVLIVLTYRHDTELEIDCTVEIGLTALDPEETRTLARGLASKELPAALIDDVVERSDGVPLFVEELVAAAGEVDDGSGLPTSLQSLLLARLDRLGPARSVAQLAAVIGRTFHERLLVAAAHEPASSVVDALQTLADARLIVRGASPDGPRCAFRHALIRDAAYASMLRAQRTELHRAVARALTEEFPNWAKRYPELLGHHLAQGQEPLRAAYCYEQAGRLAAAAAALPEAIAHYKRGIELLADAPAGEERDRREMWIDILLGNAMMGLEGIGADSTRPVWERAIELGERIGDPEELTAALNGLAVQELESGDPDAAERLALRQIEIADESDSRVARLRGEGTLGGARFYRGQGQEAITHLSASLSCYREGDFGTVTFGVGHDQGIGARTVSAWALWWLGRPDLALAEAEEAVRRAERLGSFLTVAMARHFQALIYQFRRESETALAWARQNAALAHELRFGQWEGLALMTAGTERVRLGASEGLTEIGEGISLLRDTHIESGASTGLAFLAEAQHLAGDTKTALAVVEGALARSRERGQPFWDPELIRLKAEFILALDPSASATAEALLRQAFSQASDFGAGGLALRAATPLARMLGERSSGSTARRILTDALSAVHGGESTLDVREARAVLDDLTVGAI
jgi:class 3 adenylate cyclase/tetratricopeptide (TPR) repeat protein